MAIQEEEVLGKAYDARLMKRLLTYLHSYRWQVAVALVAIVLKAGADVLGPYLTKVAIDKYLASRTEAHSLLDRWLSPQPLTGIAQIAAMYVGLLLFSFLLEFTQTYIMQWTGQKVMFDLRSADLPPSATAAHFVLRQESGRPAGHARHQRRGRAERDVHRRRGLDLRRHLRAARAFWSSC